VNSLLLLAILFGVASLIEVNRTYLILFFAALVNLAMYPFTSEYSVVLEGSLDLIILVSLLIYGDRHKLYQTGLLFCALFIHLQFELDQVNGTNLIFDNYGTVITGVTIMQLSGVFHGISQRIRKSNYSWGLRPHSIDLYRYKVWPKN